MTAVGILGVGVTSGYGLGTAALSAGLRDGTSAVRALEPGAWPSLVQPRFAALVPDIDDMTLTERVTAALPVLQGSLGRALRGARRSLRLGLLAAAEALANGGGDGAEDDDLALVVAGSNLFAGAVAEAEARRLGGDRVSGRHGVEMFDTHAVGYLSALLGCRGPGMSVGAASASGMAAIVAAVDLLAAGRASRCLVVGLPADLGTADWAALDVIGALADGRAVEDGRICIPFDRAATGFVPGEMSGALLLGPPEAASIRITGSALRLDGTAQPSPSLTGEIRVMREALAMAALEPSAIDLISAHATSTPLGDKTEADAIAELFGEAPQVNAPKGLIGHGMNAAALVETAAVCAQITGGFVHANARIETPVRPLGYVGAQSRAAELRRVLKTGFGFGGFNAALVLEAAA